MKRILIIALLTAVLGSSYCIQKEPPRRFSYSPEKPSPGDEITVQYSPQGTNLEKADEVYLVAYSYTQGTPEAYDCTMTKTGDAWNASLKAEDKSRGIIIKFVHEEDVDSNDKKGYVIPLFGPDGNPVLGGLSGLAEAYASWGRYFAGLETDQKLAYAYFEEEFATHPEMKREYIIPYLTTVAAVKENEGLEIILRELGELAGKNDLSEEELSLMVNWYTRLKQPEKSQKYAALIREKYPKGKSVQDERFQEFYRTKDVRQKITLMEKFKKDFPESEYIPALHMYICFAFRDLGQYAEIKKYLDKVPEEINWSFYNNIAWGMAEKDIELELAAEFAARGIKLARQEQQDPKSNRPSYISEREAKDQMKMALAMALDTYAFILIKLDRPGEALSHLEEAILLSQGKNPEVNERYVQALVQSGSHEKAVSEIGKLIQEGQGTARMKDLYKQAYIEQTGNEEEAASQLLKLEKIAREKMITELKETMIDSPAPDFILEDLDGHSISLVDLRGKIVILDFWATWCGPCITSFPGMKIVVEKYRDDESVRFLFINSWERVQDWKKNASEFMSTNDYPFHVLLDTENKVITAFGVEGIPTKFIIDKKGKIRFKSVGYMGSTDKLVEELSLMIETLR